MTFSIMTLLSMKGLYVTLSITDTEDNNALHYTVCRYAECRYAECRFAECCYAVCRYAECCGALVLTRPAAFDNANIIYS